MAIRCWDYDPPRDGVLVADGRGLAPLDDASLWLLAVNASEMDGAVAPPGVSEAARAAHEARGYYERLPDGYWRAPDGRRVPSVWTPEREAGRCALCAEPWDLDGLDLGWAPMCSGHRRELSERLANKS